MRELGRLLRISLLPSAVADIVAGILLGGGGWPAGATGWLLIAGSLCVYHGGLALNDWADRDADAAVRPDRPLVSGAISPGFALALAAGLLIAGPLLGVAASPPAGRVLAVVALLAAFYDLMGRGPLLGPLSLGLCRAGNLMAGILCGWHAVGPGVAALPVELWFFPTLYALYVFTVSRLGRMEDSEDRAPLGRRPARLIAVASAVLLVLPIVPPPPLDHVQPVASGWIEFLYDWRITLTSLVVAAGAFGLLRLAFRQGTWTRGQVMAAMGMCLRRLLVFTAAVAMVQGTAAGALGALLILAGFPLSFALRRVFPPS